MEFHVSLVGRKDLRGCVEVQTLARFAVDRPRAGLLLGYGAIPTTQIPEALSRLRRCFER